MKFFIGITDNKWFNNLSQIKPDEVNFWRPSAKSFKALDIGEPFIFKLHSPLSFIVGGGFFVRYEKVPLSLAWDAFGNKNGANDLDELKKLVNLHKSQFEHDPIIGCIILNEPFFFPKEHWIKMPENIGQSGKSYDLNENSGRSLWETISNKLALINAYKVINSADIVSDHKSVYGKEYLIKSRIGQGTFRVLVTSAYKRRCAITGEKTLPVLQAAHIKPLTDNGTNTINNGLLLRSDLHILFDKGYLTVTPEKRIEVSRKIKEDFDNGKEYYPLHGKDLIILPDSKNDWPNNEHLQWHNLNVFLK
jgi:putative restriction endonuclease